MMIGAVLFDVDGVLMDSREANFAFYRAFLAKHGYTHLAQADLEMAHYLTLFDAIAQLTKQPEAEVRRLWEDARSLEGYPYELARLPDACRETLEALAEDYRLGIVTSRVREGVEQFFAHSGLAALFDVCVSYEDYSRPKPAPEPLLVACDRLGLPPAAVVYIGDAQVDLECARAAGAHFVAYGDGVSGASRVVCTFPALTAAVRSFEHE